LFIVVEILIAHHSVNTVIAVIVFSLLAVIVNINYSTLMQTLLFLLFSCCSLLQLSENCCLLWWKYILLACLHANAVAAAVVLVVVAGIILRCCLLFLLPENYFVCSASTFSFFRVTSLTVMTQIRDV